MRRRGSGVTVSLMLGTGSGGDAQGDTLINIENLTGSNFDDTLEGNGGNNVLAGGLGTDTVSYAHAASGAGGVGVTVNLATTSAQNTVTAGSDTLSGFENVTGSEFNDTLTGTGTANVLTGLGGNDTLNGGAGADTMFGGTGNDTYVVDNAGDVVNETGGDGIDTVQSSISFSLADPVHAIGSIENLTLTGTGAINATGNALDNILTGNSGANILTGGGGADILNGGGGKDTFVFHSPPRVVTRSRASSSRMIPYRSLLPDLAAGSVRVSNLWTVSRLSPARRRRRPRLRERSYTTPIVTTCCGIPMDRARAVRC